jgi:GAF domain-containing protein
MTARSREEHFLSRIVSTFTSSLELDEVLAGVVDLLSDASAVRACFVYLVDESGDELVLRAAGGPYAHLVGSVTLHRGSSLAWWSLEHREPAFIREDALADPRTTEVPEFEEHRFQSLVAVPIVSRAGGEIGAITAHSEAPREFTDDEVALLVTVSRLVAGAIENARLYADARRRVGELEALTKLGEAIARAETLEDLLPHVADEGRRLLEASACHVYLIEPGGDELHLRRSSPAGAEARQLVGLAELGPELATRTRKGKVSVPLVADDELVGLIVAEGTRRVELARALAGQVAAGVRKVRLIERLSERNLVRDFFDDLRAGRFGPSLEGRAARLSCDLDATHVVLAARPADDAFEHALLRAVPGALVDRRGDVALALLPAPRGDAAVAELVRKARDAASEHVSAGLSGACRGAAAVSVGFAEAHQALIGAAVAAGGRPVVSYDELGPYRYLLRATLGGGVRDGTVDAVRRLAVYDHDRQTQLLATLEAFLRLRGSITATSEALFIHPNTLRQRLRRIADLTDLDLRAADWLGIEIAVKMVHLERALESSASAIPEP